MAAMKPRTGDGPLEVTKEGRGIVMRVPLEGGGRLVVELTPDEADALGDALKKVVGQQRRPHFATAPARFPCRGSGVSMGMTRRAGRPPGRGQPSAASYRAEEAVAHRQQRRQQLLALADRAQQLAQAQHLRGLGGGVDRTAVRENTLEADQTARSQQAQRFSEAVQALQPVAVTEHEVVSAVRQPGSTSRARPGMKRARLAAKPAARNASRANCWRSGSGSTVVSTPSGRMPCSR